MVYKIVATFVKMVSVNMTASHEVDWFCGLGMTN